MDRKHHEISRLLLAEIASGKYPVDARLPSEAQLVKRFNVSRPTVARALRDLEASGLIERRAGSGTYLRAASDAPSFTRQLGILVAGLGSTEIFDLICGELASLSRASDYTLLWGGSGQTRQSELHTRAQALQVCDQFIERRVAGMFFTPFEFSNEKDQVNREIVERFRDAGVPVVLLDRDLLPFPQRSSYDVVGIDNFAAGYLAAEHLLRLGRQRLAFLMRPQSAATVDVRIAGVREAQARFNIVPAHDWILAGDLEDDTFLSTAFSKGRWDAVICANDLTAAQLMRKLPATGVRVPRDLRIVGFDDAKYGSFLAVPLTTVHQPCTEIALVAYRALFERIAEPTLPARSLLLTPRLVIRESCGAYLPRKSAPRASGP
jgi:DNA-binding LacI/PurR family transcriptional regulator